MSKKVVKRGRRFAIPEPKQFIYNSVEELYREYQRPLYLCFYRMTKDHQDSEDLVHDVFVKIIVGWKSMLPGKTAGFIATIAHNAKHDYYQKKYNRPQTESIEGPDDYDTHDGGFSDPLRRLNIERTTERVEAGLRLLKKSDRDILLDMSVTGMDVEDVRSKYGIKKKGGVYEKICRVRKILSATCGGRDFLPNGEWNQSTASVQE